MLNVVKIVILVVTASLFQTSLQAKSMIQFYGNDKYSGQYDYNDLNHVMKSDSTHEVRAGYKGVRSIGKHVNFKVFKNDELIIDKQRPHQSIHNIAYKDDITALENLGACTFYNDFMLNTENDAEENLKISFNNMPKWQILREPQQLRSTRHKIYFNRRAVIILNKRIRNETNSEKVALMQNVKKHFQDKVTLLYQKHNELMALDLEWKPRRWIWANVSTNNVYCYKGESFNPEEWAEVKKEIQKITEQIESIEDQVL